MIVGFLSAGLPLATPGLAALARDAAVYKDQKFSDHAPLTVAYDFRL